MSKGSKSFFPSTKGSASTPKKEGTKQQQTSPASTDVPAPAQQGQVETVTQAETVTQTIERHLSTEQRISAQDIPLTRIRPNPFQAREEFTDEDIDELAESIRRHGFISTLLVRPDPGDEGYFQLAYGERRWRAAQRVDGLDAVPCRIAHYSDEQMEDMGIVENLQRKPLNPIEEARGLYKRMQRIDPETGKPYSIRNLAEHLGVKRHRVEIPLRLIDIPPEVEAMVKQRPDTVRIAYEIAKLPTPEQRQPLINSVLEGGASTRDIIFIVQQQLEAQVAIEQRYAAAKEQEQHPAPVAIPPFHEEQQVSEPQAVPAPSAQTTRPEVTSSDAGQENRAPSGEQQRDLASAHADTSYKSPDAPGQVSAHADVSREGLDVPTEEMPPAVASLDIATWQRRSKIQHDIQAVNAVIKRWSQWVGIEESDRLSFQVETWLEELQHLHEALKPSS